MATPTQTIREIVEAEPSAAAVLQRFDIDLCAEAGASLQQLCADLQISLDQVLEKLSDAEAGGRPGLLPNPADASLSRLMQHIVRNHHLYLRRELPPAAEMASRVALRYGTREPAFHRLAEIVEALRIDLLAHLEREEQVIFPYIAQLDQQAMLAYVPPQTFRTLAMPIFAMVQEHESAQRALEEAAQLTNGFQPARHACATQIALLGTLRGFHLDLRRHLALEDNELFPRAMALDANLHTRN
ncbi:MAG: hemerythrin domain-containing protein [Acidobacteriota bacterium]